MLDRIIRGIKRLYNDERGFIGGILGGSGIGMAGIAAGEIGVGVGTGAIAGPSAEDTGFNWGKAARAAGKTGLTTLAVTENPFIAAIVAGGKFGFDVASHFGGGLFGGQSSTGS